MNLIGGAGRLKEHGVLSRCVQIPEGPFTNSLNQDWVLQTQRCHRRHRVHEVGSALGADPEELACHFLRFAQGSFVVLPLLEVCLLQQPFSRTGRVCSRAILDSMMSQELLDVPLLSHVVARAILVDLKAQEADPIFIGGLDFHSWHSHSLVARIAPFHLLADGILSDHLPNVLVRLKLPQVGVSATQQKTCFTKAGVPERTP